MMKIIATLIVVVLLAFSIDTNANENNITLEKIWKERTFIPKTIRLGRSMKDGLRYSQLEKQNTINIYDYQTGDLLETVFSSEFIPKDQKESFIISNYYFSPDENSIIIGTEEEEIYRHSTKAKHYIWNVTNKKLTLLEKNTKQQLPTFSPDGNNIAFVRDNNIYIYSIKTGKTKQITFDGEYNKIINGLADWVYEEEFSFTQGFFWSPDNQKLAYYRFDESRVKEFNMMIYGDLYPYEYRFKYPKAGEENAIVSIHIYNVNNSKTVKVDLGKNKDQYIPRIMWTNDASKLSIQRLNRHQNHFELLIADANTGKTKLAYEEKNKYYVSVTDDLFFLKDNKEFIISSEKEGYNRLYLYNMNGSLVKPLSPQNQEVEKFFGINEDSRIAFYSAYEDHPAFINLYSINIDDLKVKRLTEQNGHNNPVFSEKYKFFINFFTTMNTPPVISIHNSDGSLVKVLEDNQLLKDKMKEYDFVEKEFFSFMTSDNIELNGYIMKPSDFDPNKKYPVLLYVYGGPGSQTVTNRWDTFNGVWYQMLVKMGYIIASIDNRGTGGRGEEFKKMTYLQLGKYETIDQIEAAKYLGNIDYIDESRIGIFGWSYGGYMSSLCISLGADYFKTAIAVAPVTHWKFYDTIYTERYMRTPQENPNGYELFSPINHTAKIKGNYLLVHGSADDNVHYQNAIEMIYSLIDEDVSFDLMIYPNQNHGISGGNSRLHLYRIMTEFILNKL
ncbi:MAG: S9 family peptidase [Bacteroidetes bacterium]|nr:S9 family peptidase [Bacteroidota bacterium]